MTASKNDERTHVETRHIGTFRNDPRNVRRHNPRNASLVEKSIQTDGFGRSMLAARDGVIIAGNQTLDGVGNIGMENAIVVHSDGTKPIIVVRDDLDSNSESAARLAIADNRATDLSAFDADRVVELSRTMNVSDFWSDHEMQKLIAQTRAPESPDEFPAYDQSIETQYACPKCGYSWSGKPK